MDVSDLLPTFCELAGVEKPLGLDGISIAPTLTGTGIQRARDFIIHESQPDRSIIRGDHKLIDDIPESANLMDGSYWNCLVYGPVTDQMAADLNA